MKLVNDPNNIRLGMVGWVDDNHHPYSWSAIINGSYDDAEMAQCDCPGVVQYLAANRKSLGIDGMQVTHVWCDNPARAGHLSRCNFIPHVVDRPEDVIGEVDAVLIPTDDGHHHVERARPFIEAGLPLFIDKPLTNIEDHLEQFVQWHNEGKAFVSGSCMRYSEKFEAARQRIDEVGELRALTCTMCKRWPEYGIHALESVYPFVAPGGWLSVADTGSEDASIVHAHHDSGVEAILIVISDMFEAAGRLGVYGTDGALTATHSTNFRGFKILFEKFATYLRTGEPPCPFEQTVELIKMVIAARHSREQGGRTVKLSQVKPQM